MRTSSSASPEPTITTGKHSIPQHGHIARCPLFLSTVWAKRRRAIDALSTSPLPSMRPRLHRRRLKAGAGLGTEPVSARPETGRRINRCAGSTVAPRTRSRATHPAHRPTTWLNGGAGSVVAGILATLCLTQRCRIDTIDGYAAEHCKRPHERQPLIRCDAGGRGRCAGYLMRPSARCA